MAKEVTEILEAMTAEDLKRRREIAEKLFSEHFSSHEARKRLFVNLRQSYAKPAKMPSKPATKNEPHWMKNARLPF